MAQKKSRIRPFKLEVLAGLLTGLIHSLFFYSELIVEKFVRRHRSVTVQLFQIMNKMCVLLVRCAHMHRTEEVIHRIDYDVWYCMCMFTQSERP